MLRTFVFSCSVFNGFTVILNVNQHDTLQELTQACVANLKLFLKSNNLDLLLSQVDKMNYHIHSTTLQKILEVENKIYVCNCPQVLDIHM